MERTYYFAGFGPVDNDWSVERSPWGAREDDDRRSDAVVAVGHINDTYPYGWIGLASDDPEDLAGLAFEEVYSDEDRYSRIREAVESGTDAVSRPSEPTGLREVL